MYSKLPILAALISVVLISLGLTSPSDSGATGLSTGLSTGVTTTTGGTTGSHSITVVTNDLTMTNLDEKKSSSSYGNFSGTWTTHTGVHIAGIQYTFSTNTTTSTSSTAHLTGETNRVWLFVVAGTELGPPSGATMSSDTAPSGAVQGFEGASGQVFDVQTSSSGAISSGTDLHYWILRYPTFHWDNGPDTDGTRVWTEFKYELDKLACGDASLTTRKTYGQPDKGGELPADPNAPPRYVKYGGWDYKGGIFVGNMPDTGSDMSGTARIDFFPSGGSSYTSYTMAALSLFDLGKPTTSGLTGAIDVGAYVPSSFGSATESSVNWGNQFTFTPDGSYASHMTLTDGNSNDYLVFKVGGASLQGYALAIVNESTLVGAGTECWHYFASSEYKAEQSSFPGNDSNPRVWVIVPY